MTVTTWVLWGLALPVLSLCLGLSTLYLLQRWLLYPPPKRNAVTTALNHHVQELRIPVGQRQLRAYLATPHQPTPKAQGLVYFNGRREHPTSIFRALHALPDHHVLCFHYDQWGLTWRKPTEAQLVDDALAVLDWFARSHQLPLPRLAVAGRSLGSGIAVQVAAQRPVARLALISPHDRLISAVRVKLPGLPQWMLKDRFDSVAHIRAVRCPCLLVVGEQDRAIPPALSDNLMRAWHGHCTPYRVADAGHRGLLRRHDVHTALARFLHPPSQDIITP